TPEYLKALRELCDASGALLIFDEVQCGMGRTGDLYAYMGYGVTPDILTTAKALGNGYPVGAMLTTTEIAAAFSVGAHGTTYGGNPLAAAVALKVLQIINTPAFLARVKQASQNLRGKLQAIVEDYPQVFTEVRGSGLMLGMVLAQGYLGRAKEISKAAEHQGLMVLIAGPDVVRLLPALVVSDAQIEQAVQLLRAALDAFLSPAQ
ncbi:MAG TPA: bifunctional succinylornithine transaminase/acetylornithine transaminase, partial [Oxalobacteraceae bacterium]|nr:bifunctional succinylornithine transaminase/acetylornithine transaminase [Oxalobacteraceae bacterium]